GLDRDGRAWLPARLREDGDCFRVRDARTARLLRRNLGTILAERMVTVLLEAGSASEGFENPLADASGLCASGFPLGEVDESFADRLQPGDRFLLDGRCLEVRGSEVGALRVAEVAGRPRVPRWIGSGWPLSPELAWRGYLLPGGAAEALREPDQLEEMLRRDYGLDGEAVRLLAEHFQRQETISEIPDTDTLLVEVVGWDSGVECFLHTPLNRLANDALARVAVAR